MNSKKNILILCDWFLPGYKAGGPIQSIATLTSHLGRDFNFKIITTDRDFKSHEPYPEIEADQWTVYEGREVFYVSPGNMRPDFIFNLIASTPHDTIYLNSLFSKLFTIYPLKWKQQGKIRSRIILAPRGMLRDAALAVKPLKKKLFLWYAGFTRLFKDVHWQSTSARETMEIRKRIGNVTITELSNLPDTINSTLPIEKKADELRLCFIARIVEIKNLHYAIQILKTIKTGSVIFDVFGPKEDEAYWKNCAAQANELPENIQFSYRGSLEPETIPATLGRYHALFLPTQTENFGHVIVQSLQCGRPVIISDNTPWRELKQKYAGYDIDLETPQAFKEAIGEFLNMDQPDYNLFVEGSAAYINSVLNTDRLKKQYIALFNL